MVDEDDGEGRNHVFADLNLGIQSGVIEKDANKCDQSGEDSNDDQYERHPDSTHAKMGEDKDENDESHTMWENELVQLLMDTANLNINGEVWEHRLRDMVTEMERYQEDRDSALETKDTALADLEEEQNMPWWLEDDIEEDVITNTSITTPNSRDIISVPEELLADWYQIEEDLKSSEDARSEGNGDDIGNNEADPSKTEALLAEWYLWEESLKAEGHLKFMELQGGMDEANQIEIRSIVANAAVKIRNVLDTAQAEIRKLLMESDTTTTSDSTDSVNYEEVFEQDKDFPTNDDADRGSIWTKSCDSDSHCSNSALHLISSDTGVGTVEGIQLYLDFNRDEDQDEENLSLYLDLSCDNKDQELTDCWSVHSEMPQLKNRLGTSGLTGQPITTWEVEAAVDGSSSQEMIHIKKLWQWNQRTSPQVEFQTWLVWEPLAYHTVDGGLASGKYQFTECLLTCPVAESKEKMPHGDASGEVTIDPHRYHTYWWLDTNIKWSMMTITEVIFHYTWFHGSL